MEHAGGKLRVFAAAFSAAWLALPLSALLAQAPVSRSADQTSSVKISDHESQPALKRLVNVREFLSAGHWDEAVETLREVMERYPDQMTRLPDGRYVNIRNFCHMQLAEWQSTAPEALKLYRERVDPLAKRWHDEGLAARDITKLQQVVDQFLCSSWGDDALLVLGELELHAGHFGAARNHWERISPLLKSAEGSPLWLALYGVDLNADWKTVESIVTQREATPLWPSCISTDIDLAGIRARLVLTSILEGSLERAGIELALLNKLSPQATGLLAGKEGVYATRLQELLDLATHWPAEKVAAGWLTFAGNPERNKHSPEPVRVAGTAWKKPVVLDGPLQPEAALHRVRVGEGADGLQSFFPVVTGNLLLVSGPRGIRALRLDTGLPAWVADQPAPVDDLTAIGRFFAEERTNTGLSRAGQATDGVPRYTMTVHSGRLFARIGDSVTSWASDGFRERRANYLACFDLDANGALLWKASPQGETAVNQDESRWAFEGAPLSDGPNVYVAVRRSERPPQAYVVCLDAQTGKQKWRRLVCEAERSLVSAERSEITHNLLTMDEGTIYYNTNLGAVAALRASDGRLEWVQVYERQFNSDLSESAAFQDRDLNPCVYNAGILYVAPRECLYVMALDASTGALLWRTDLPRKIVHLLGVHDNKLIASGNQLWWIDIRTRKCFCWPENDNSGLRACGRGTIAGSEIYWPVRDQRGHTDQIMVFDTQQAMQSRVPILLGEYGASCGNLVAVDGYLLVAGATEMVALTHTPQPPEEPTEKLTFRAKQIQVLGTEY